MAPYRIAIMSDDMVKFGYDSMQKRTKFMKSTSLRTFKVKFLKCQSLSPVVTRGPSVVHPWLSIRGHSCVLLEQII